MPERKRFAFGKKYDYISLLFILPIFVFLAIFVYYGIAFNIFVSFFKWNGVSPVKTFIGFKNYTDLFKDPYFRASLIHTLIFLVITVPIQAILGFLIAVCLDRKIVGKQLFKSVFFVPNIMSLVVITVVFCGIYNYSTGSLNAILKIMNLGWLAKDWLGDTDVALYSVIAINIYTYLGFSMILYITGILGIPEDVIEAAQIDGASFWRTIKSIVLPLLKNVHFTLLILGVIGTLKTFDIVWLSTEGGPARSTEMISTLLYREYVLQYKAGYSASISIVILLIAFVLTSVQLYFSRKFDY